MLNIFSCTCCSSLCFPWENVYSDPLPLFLNQVFCLCFWCGVMSSLYMLCINPLSDILFANTSSCSVGRPFILPCENFYVDPFIYFCFCFPRLGKCFQKTSSNLMIIALKKTIVLSIVSREIEIQHILKECFPLL